MRRETVRQDSGLVSEVSLILTTVLTIGCGGSLPVVEGDIAFVDVSVLPMGGPGSPVVLENQTVVVADRRIASINPSDQVEVGDDVEIVEAKGQYLMPGLSEMYGHLPSPQMLPADSKNLLFLYVANGVTTVRGMHGDRPQFTLRDQIARGELIGPRLFLGSRPMNGAQVTTPDQAEQLVREYKQTGYDFVKVHEGLTGDVFDAMANVAREIGITFGGHVSDEVGLFHTLESGQSSIDHLDNYIQALVPEGIEPPDHQGLQGDGDFWDHSDFLIEMVDEVLIPKVVEATRAAGAWMVPTMVLWETVFYSDRSAAEIHSQRPEVRYMPPEIVEEWVRALDEHLTASDSVTNRRVSALRRTILQALQSGGVPILLGTDSPQIFSVPGFAMHREMALWVEIGMTPYQVLEAGTRLAAEYFDATDEFGSIVVGHRADLLLLTANPIEDIANVARRAGVMVNGRWLQEQQIQDRLADIATFYGN